nr:MAG TPA: 50S ribosomal protein L2 [Caudoviricetes sp.]
MLVLCTCGLWLLVPKRKSTSRTNIRTRKMAICNTCGYSWEVK